MDRLGLPFDEERQCEPSRYSMDAAYEATRRLLDRCPELTAIFAMSDVMAMGVLRALRDLGKRVPEEISVVGFDGIPMADYLVPATPPTANRRRRLLGRVSPQGIYSAGGTKLKPSPIPILYRKGACTVRKAGILMPVSAAPGSGSGTAGHSPPGRGRPPRGYLGTPPAAAAPHRPGHSGGR